MEGRPTPLNSSTSHVAPHAHPSASVDGTRLWITVTQRHGKPVTVVDGFDRDADLDAIARDVRQHLASPASVQHGRLELAGDQAARVAPLLHEMVSA
jgi:translation initiation factor 1 (eIF-1/SUI1)